MSVRICLSLLLFLVVAEPSRAQWPYFVADINPGATDSTPTNFVDVNGVLFFAANDGVNGIELWKSDGTTAGTVLVKDINPGAANSFPTKLTDVNGTLYFSANDGVNGTELWKSDGTSAGTVLVLDIYPGANSSSPDDLTAFGSLVFFGANTSVGTEPWISDGTAPGTMMLQDICPLSCSSALSNTIVVGGVLYFANTYQQSLWQTDGTPLGTLMVRASVMGTTGNVAELGGKIYFRGNSAGSGDELFVSDGTFAGTMLVKDIYPGTLGSAPAEITNVNGTLYFQARDDVHGAELWRSDGTSGGTTLVKDIHPIGGSTPQLLTGVGDRVFFRANDGVYGQEIWTSDGTAGGTLVKDVRTGSSSSSPADLLAVKDTLLFTAFGRLGDEVYRTSETIPDSRFVDDIVRGLSSSNPSSLTRVGPLVFFAADDGVVGRELWALRVDELLHFTVTSRDSENLLEWMNPLDASVQIRFRTDTFPANDTDGTLLVTAAGQGDTHESFSHAPVTNDTTYYYRAFAFDAALNVVSTRTAKGRPQSTAGPVQWIYNTGAVATEPPGLFPVTVLSNDWTLHSVALGDSGGTWSSGFRPFRSKALAQGRPPVAPVPLAPASRTVFFSSNEGVVYAVDADTGEYLWRSPNLGLLQASPAAMFTDLGGAYDLVLVGSRDASENSFRGLSRTLGNVNWTFNNSGNGIGPISGQASVDYTTTRVYFGSQVEPSGTDRTVWCLGLFSGSLVWSRGVSDLVPIGDVDQSPTLRGTRLYVGTNDSKVHALDAAGGTDLWTAPFDLNNGAVKSFIWAPRDGNELYLSTTDKVWALNDDGTMASEIWQTSAIPLPSVPLRVGDYLYVGGDDGKLYEIDLTIGPSSLKSIVLGDGTARVGAPSFDLPRFLIYVGTESGAIYALRAPFPP